MEELIKSMEAAATEMRKLLGKVDDADSDEKRAEYQTALKLQQEEFDALKAKYTAAKAQSDAEATVAAAKAASVPANTPNITGGVKDTPADEATAEDIFFRFCGHGKSVLSDRELDRIACKDSRIDASDLAVNLPPRFVQKMMRGKAILSTDTTGGATDSGASNLLAPDFRPELQREPVYMPNLFDLCRVVPAYNGKATWPKLDQSQGNFGGVAFTWKAAEGADKEETEPTFTDFEITTHELSGWTEASLQALRRSAINLEETLGGLFRDAAGYEFSRVILHGTGINRPTGILRNPASSGVKLVGRKEVNKLGWTDLTSLEYALTMGFRAGGRYIISDGAERYLKETVDNEKRPLFTRDGTTATGVRDIMAGYPVTAHEHGPEAGDTGDVIFGNPQNYMFAVEENIAIARSEHAEFKKGRVVFRMIAFVGGKMLHPSGFAVLSDETSPEISS